MSSSTKACPDCDKSVDTTHYARHVKSHNVKFKCKQCPSLQFNRRDNLARHMKLHGPQFDDEDEPSTSAPYKTQQSHSEDTPFTVDKSTLKRNLIIFKVDAPITNKIESAEFQHPFACKVMGPRGSGKTSFTVSYIQKVACFQVPKIFIVTASPNQPLYTTLRENNQVFFINLTELETVVEKETNVLIVLDDMMQETRYNATLEKLFTRGRHAMISIMSLEQDPFYSSHIERRNADYFVLTRMRDTSCLAELYKKFCRDIQQWRFIELY